MLSGPLMAGRGKPNNAGLRFGGGGQELHLISGLVALENGRVSLQLKWAVAGRWGDVAPFQKGSFPPRPRGKGVPIADSGVFPRKQTFKIHPQRTEKYLGLGG
ncbi:hypothetical protein DQ04_24061000, partial [Trypanosoma grayi]|uniref:hypothetical protein n=1 Tax=Trypanosoma grayi TaxID=71804 RepID=UPI0004F43E0D